MIDFQDSLSEDCVHWIWNTGIFHGFHQSKSCTGISADTLSQVMARRHGLHALTVLLGMTTAQLPRSRPGTLTPAARQMIASVRGVTPGVRGPDPIIDRIDRATKAELESCKAWASKGDLSHKGQAMKCPINAFFSAVALDNTRGTVPKARFAGRSFVPPRGWGLPRDAVCRRAAQTFRSRQA